MFREIVATLRQRRYAALAALMSVVAGLCVLAGTWQVSRFEQSVRDNRALRGNARAAPVPLTTSLVRLVGDGPTPGRDAIRYCTVTITGTFVPHEQYFVRRQSEDGVSHFDVLSPLRTSAGILLVVRGSIDNGSSTTPPKTVPLPPRGELHLSGRLQTAEAGNDAAGRLQNSVLLSVNPAQQAARSGSATYNAYLTLLAGQPGTRGVTPTPRPNLSNPAGGAYEAQHFAYIIQWYLFALLALIAPFWIRRHEIREARRKFFGRELDELELAGMGIDDVGALQAGSAGSAALHAGSAASAALEGAGSSVAASTAAAADSGAEVAVRPGSMLATAAETAERWERAARLADRYGLSIGDRPVPSGRRVALRALALRGGIRNSARAPHPSHDAYHGAYNDYLWQLALADGELADVSPAVEERASVAAPPPTVIDVTPEEIVVEPSPQARPVERSDASDGPDGPAGPAGPTSR